MDLGSISIVPFLYDQTRALSSEKRLTRSAYATNDSLTLLRSVFFASPFDRESPAAPARRQSIIAHRLLSPNTRFA